VSGAPGRQGGHYVSTSGDGALVCGAFDKEAIVGSSHVSSSEDTCSNGTTDGPEDDSEPSTPVVSPQEPSEHQPNSERSPFVSIGGGLVALDLVIPSRVDRPPVGRQPDLREVQPFNNLH
jgi:hypothetical protein